MADPQTKIIITAKDEASGVFDRLNTNVKGVAAAVAGAFAADSLLGFAQSLVPVADAASELEARLRLAVGESGNLDAALQAVRESANQTGAEINSIGELYGRVASSTSELGFSQQRVAALTDTINKSFSVSGTSAQAASGAITQLAQAFASGALRGDEFNSVNEAAPRLMDALAAGLGVARGELRAMAEQGKLTTEVVLTALESQRDAIERDFEQLPDTVGRATQKLANEWQVFIGELNKTSGASEAVAGGLTMIADNLDEIASVAATAGEILVAGLAVKAAGALRGFVGAASLGTAASGAVSASITGLAAAGQAATASILALGRALPALGVAGIVVGVGALAVEFFRAKSAAEDADEAVRKMLEEPPVNHVAQEIRLVATEAEAVRFKLAEVQQQFISLTASGISAADALAKIAAAANLSSVDGVAQLVADMQLLEQSALATGAQIQTAIAERLAKLSSQDLRDFGLQAEMAFARGEISAEQLAEMMESRVVAAAKKLGAELSLSTDGFSNKFREAAGNLDVVAGSLNLVAKSGRDTAVVFEQGLAGALKQASSPKEFEYLNSVILKAGENGDISKQRVEALLDMVRDKSDQATPGINSMNEALKALGVTSDKSLQDTANRFREAYEAVVKMGGSVREQTEAFKRYAQAAIAANGGVATEALKAEAAMHKLVIETDSAGRAVVKSMTEAAGSLDRVRTSATGAATAAGQIADEVDTVGPAAARAAKAMESVYLAIQKAGKAVSQNMALYGRWAQQLEEIAALNDKIGKQQQFLGGASGGIERDDSDADWQKEIKDRFNKWDEEIKKSRETGPAAGSTFYRQARNKGLAGDLTADEIARFNDLAAASYEKNRGNGNRPINNLDQWLNYLDGRNNRAIQDALNQIRAERKEEQSGGGGGSKNYNVTIRLPGMAGRTVKMASDEDAQELLRILEELERRSQ